MPAPRIFISYRRDDTAGYARAICDALGQRFGADRVFIDVDDIAAGQTFSDVIEQALGASEVLLVLIGKRWRGERETGPARLDDPADLVRREVAAGLAHCMHVIPLLVDGVAMPVDTQLPAELRPLAGRHALELGNSRFAADLDRLVTALRPLLGETVAPPAPSSARSRRMLWRGLLGALLVAGVAAGLWQWRGASDRSAAARPPINGTWHADVEYDWPNARFRERFVFSGDAGELQGSASFLGVPRGLLNGRVERGGLRFVTRTTEVSGGDSTVTVHRYRGRLDGGVIRFVMQTEGGASAHVPVEFVARRAAAANR